MRDGNFNHPGNEGVGRQRVEPAQRPYWKRAHRDWRVWVGLFFMLSAMTIYILSEDLSFFGSGHRAPMSDSKGL